MENHLFVISFGRYGYRGTTHDPRVLFVLGRRTPSNIKLILRCDFVTNVIIYIIFNTIYNTSFHVPHVLFNQSETSLVPIKKLLLCKFSPKFSTPP